MVADLQARLATCDIRGAKHQLFGKGCLGALLSRRLVGDDAAQGFLLGISLCQQISPADALAQPVLTD